MQVTIREDRCIGCGACVWDCLRALLRVEAGKARIKEGGACIACGHCVAVCPMDAVRLEGRPEEELRPYDPAVCDIPAEQLLSFMKFRRSTRQFKDQPVEEEKLSILLEAARYAPTGGNRQMTRYILLEQERVELGQLAMESLYHAAARLDTDPSLKGMEHYREKWLSMYPAWKERGEDGLFFHAPCVLVAVTDPRRSGTGRVDAALAAANVELVAHALGLGVCYIGLFTAAAAITPELRRRLALQDGEEVVATLAMGYPDVRYFRMVNRNPANLTRM